MTENKFNEIIASQIDALRAAETDEEHPFSELLRLVSEKYAEHADNEEKKEADRALKKFRVVIMDSNKSIFWTDPCTGTSMEEFRNTFVSDIYGAEFLSFPDGSSVSVKHIVSFKIDEIRDNDDQDRSD